MARRLSPEHKAKLQAGRMKWKQKKDDNKPSEAENTMSHNILEENDDNTGRIENSTSHNIQGEPSASRSEPSAITLLLQKLMAEIEELKKQKNPEMTPEAALQYTAHLQGQPTIGRNGIQGRMVKYPVDAGYYPNPIDRLYDEPTLSRFNLRENYYFDWEVDGVEYEKYGVTYAEPKFTVRLFRRLYDEDGQPNGRFALINRQIQHEDEVVARAAADKLGLTGTFDSFEDMMNEIRYYRIKQWLLDLFKPPKIETHKNKPTQQVIDGKVVEVFDTEALIDGESGISKAGSINREVRI